MGALALAAAVIVFLATRPGGHGRPRAASQVSPTPTHAPLSQAHWQVRAFPSGVTSRVTKKDLKAVKRQEPRAARAVKNIYHALLLGTPPFDRILRVHFEAPAAKAFLKVRRRLPGRIARIRTTARHLQIGIDAASGHKAIASVRVLLKAKRGSQRIRIKHNSTLWLELKHRSWRVIAWRAQQRPRR